MKYRPKEYLHLLTPNQIHLQLQTTFFRAVNLKRKKLQQLRGTKDVLSRVELLEIMIRISQLAKIHSNDRLIARQQAALPSSKWTSRCGKLFKNRITILQKTLNYKIYSRWGDRRANEKPQFLRKITIHLNIFIKSHHKLRQKICRNSTVQQKSKFGMNGIIASFNPHQFITCSTAIMNSSRSSSFRDRFMSKLSNKNCRIYSNLRKRWDSSSREVNCNQLILKCAKIATF